MLKDYLWEIFAIAEEHNKDVGVGRDMLAANLDKGAPVAGQPWYAGADKLDYVTLHKQWAALSGEERAAEKQEAEKLMGEHYKALAAAWKKRDRAAFEAVLNEGV